MKTIEIIIVVSVLVLLGIWYYYLHVVVPSNATNTINNASKNTNLDVRQILFNKFSNVVQKQGKNLPNPTGLTGV